MARTGILGGTFNPVHIGHLRLALETAERLRLDRVLLMPCHTPAHKSSRGLLPFSLRVELLCAACAGSTPLEVTTIESSLPAPSYTWNSLLALQNLYPDDTFVFILGAEDFASLATWKRGPELPSLMDFAVMARAESGRESFRHTIATLWPGTPVPDGDTVPMPAGTSARFVVMPPLCISASLIREKWLAGQDITFLVPDAALGILNAHREEVTACWKAADPTVE